MISQMRGGGAPTESNRRPHIGSEDEGMMRNNNESQMDYDGNVEQQPYDSRNQDNSQLSQQQRSVLEDESKYRGESNLMGGESQR